jgi:hypothetical protein
MGIAEEEKEKRLPETKMKLPEKMNANKHRKLFNG